MAEADLLASRLQKLADLEARGVDAFPARADVDCTIQALREQHEPSSAVQLEESIPAARIAGRFVALREHGKSAFADLDDGSGKIQCHFRQSVLGEDAYREALDLDLGDIVNVCGTVFRTRTDELTVKVDSYRLLTKALRPMPEKWHGLKDTEVRYRQRYLDLMANPEVGDVFRRRAEIVRTLRAHLDANGFLEVETPTLQPLYGGASARPFRTHHNTLDMDLYLRIAPELYLKRLLVGGLQRVYDLNRNFRNEGVSRQHNPEFTMLEFYAAYWDYARMMDFAEELMCMGFGSADGDLTLTYQGEELSFARPWERLSLRQVLIERGGLDAALVDDEEALRSWCAAHDVPTEGHRLGGLREAVLDKVIKPKIRDPLFVIDYPLEISPLSKCKPDDADTVERFELYFAGMEVANGYSELNDPRDQAARMREQVANRDASEEAPPDVDEDYVAALEYGMPPAAGIGIGIDRMVMVATDSASIRDVILFPLMRSKDQ